MVRQRTVNPPSQDMPGSIPGAPTTCARAGMADRLVLETSALGRGGSSPLGRTLSSAQIAQLVEATVSKAV